MSEFVYQLEMRFRIVSTALAILFVLSYQVVPCSADVVVSLSIEGMTEEADVILLGTVVEILHNEASPYTIDKRHRQVTVSVEKYLKNPQDTKTVRIVDLEMWALVAPAFHESERVLLFLRDDPTFLDENPLGYYQLLGLADGKFTVSSDRAINGVGMIEDGLKIGEIEFNLGERSIFENLVFPVVTALLSIGVIYLLYRTRAGT